MSRGLNVFVNIGGKLLPSLNSTASAVEKRFGLMSKRMKIQAAEMKATWRSTMAAASPLMGLAAAGGLMFSAKAAIGESSHIQHELQMLRNAGRTTREVAAAMAQANRTITALPTTTLTDNLKVLNETTGAFGSFQHALENLTFNQRIGSMMTNMLGDKAGTPGDMFNSIVRAMEMRGAAQDHTRYQKEVGQLYRAMVFTGGRFNPEEFFNYSQQANPYTKGMSLRYLSKIAPSLIQEFGGERAGTMQNTWTGTILGKAKNKISTEAWIKLGLLDPKQVIYNKVGPVGFKPGAMKGTDLALSDPLAWSEKVLIPALKKQGVNTGNQLALAKALMPLFRDRNANRLANALVNDLDRKRLHKDEALINRVPTAEAADEESNRKDPLKAWSAVKASLTNMLGTMFGGNTNGDNPVAVALINIAKGINTVARAFQDHPWLGKGVGGLLLGATGLAGLRVLGIGLRFALSPLRALMPVWRLFFSSVGAMGPRVPWILRMGRALMTFGRFIGPMLLRTIVMGLGLLTNPVGWAIMAVIAAALIWRFRHEIAAWFNRTVVPWFKGAWAAIKNTALSINWGSIGMRIADALTFGLASKFAAGLARLKPAAAALAGNVGMNSTRGGLAGARARGGPVRRGGLYLVGENGPELWRAPANGRITNARRTAALLGAAGAAMTPMAAAASPAPMHVTINVNGAHDPAAVAVAVRHELAKLANGQAALLSD